MLDGTFILELFCGTLNGAKGFASALGIRGH
jgi:hypothetical protein